MATDCLYYTYVWSDANGTPFYVGKGAGKRAYETNRRSKEFKAIHACGGCTVEIVDWFIHESQAHSYECELISRYGRREFGGTLVNKTDGGEGVSGYVPSQSTRLKIAASNTGKSHTDETRSRLSGLRKGSKASLETRGKMRASHLALNRDQGRRDSLSRIHKLRLSDPVEREKRRACMRRDDVRLKLSVAAKRRAATEEWQNLMRGKNATPEARAKNRDAQLSAPPRTDHGYKGVLKSGHKWRAKIVVSGKAKCLGTFEKIEDAAKAYDNAAVAISESAWLNFSEHRIAA